MTKPIYPWEGWSWHHNTPVFTVDSLTSRRTMMKINESSFWAAWQEGMDVPTIFPNHTDAKEEVAELARGTPGVKAYLLKLEQVGSAITTDMVLKGRMAEEVEDD